MAQQQYQGPDGTIYEEVPGGGYRVVSGPQQAPSAPQGGFVVKQADPARQYEAPMAAANLAAKQAGLANAPYDARRAAADAAKAEAEAVKASRDLAAQQATASPQQQKLQAALANDEILAAITKARADVSNGHSAGIWARLPQMVQPESAVNLTGSLNTIQARLTLDKLAQLKSASPTGASGLGSLTEKEGELLRDSVAGLGQTQSPDRLLENLAAVERHYRNFRALTNGEDYRDPKIAERYGIAIAPGGKVGGPPGAGGSDGGNDGKLSLSRDGTQSTPDPSLRGVNNSIRAMIASGRPAGDIVAYMNRIQPGLGDARAPDVQAAVGFRAQNPTVPMSKYVISVENSEVPLGTARSLTNAAAQSPFGAAAMSAGDAVTAGNLARFTDNPALARAGMGAVQKESPVSSLIGTGIGGALAGVGIEAALPARLGMGGAGLLAPRALTSDAIYGGAFGASQDPSKPLTGALTGIAEGVGGGMFGRGFIRGVGNASRGVRNDAAQYLREAGIPLTIGQIASQSGRLGAKIARREDRLAGYPGVGENINDQRRNSLVGFNRAMFDQTLEPIATNTAGQIGETGVENALDATTAAYRNALSGVHVPVDPQFNAEYAAAQATGSAIPRTGPEFQHVVNTRVEPFVGSGALNGPQIQDMLQGLRRADLGTDAMGSDANAALGGVENAITGLVGRHAPDAMPGLENANRAYRNTSIAADAVGRAINTDGIVTPAQLGYAARANATRFGSRMGAATTDRPFFDLQRYGQQVLPSKIPDSGTAGRLDAGKGILGTVKGAVRNAVNAPLYSDTLQPYINAGLLDRPDWAVTLGDQINRRARIGGMFGAPIVLQYSTTNTP